MTESKNSRQGYVNSYNRDNYRTISIRFNLTTEEHLIRAIAESGSPKDYITRLITEDLRRHGVAFKTKDDRMHDDPVSYPYEVLEIPNKGTRFIIGYCRSLDDAKELLIRHVESQKHGCGAMRIVKREIKDLGGRAVMMASQPDMK